VKRKSTRGVGLSSTRAGVAAARRRCDCHLQRFKVAYEYPVCFTRGLFDPSNDALARVLALSRDRPRLMLACVDDGVAAARPRLIPSLEHYLAARPGLCRLVRPPEVVPGGERTKNGWNVVQSIMAAAGQSHLCRHSFVMAVGGGSVLDMVGFAASLVHRGLRLIRVPTTVLSQSDGGVGVKTGMDEHGMKNFAGTFAPPFAVLVDFDMLRTLDSKYRTGGIAEAFKVALIKDARLFSYLCRNAGRLAAGNEAAIEHVVRRTAVLHLEHIREGGDPFEFGSARPLDFGHWAAHRLEVMSHYRLGHGQAVAIGIALDTCYAAAKGLVSARQRDRVLAAMRAVGLPLWDNLLDADGGNGLPAVLRGLEEFREHLGGQLAITLPRGIGDRVEVHEVDLAAMCACIGRLRPTS
jgi:3-dehydroquinate synthase